MVENFCRLASYCSEGFIKLVNKVMYERHNHKNFPINFRDIVTAKVFHHERFALYGICDCLCENCP